jgi:hypothetical protein
MSIIHVIERDVAHVVLSKQTCLVLLARGRQHRFGTTLAVRLHEPTYQLFDAAVTHDLRPKDSPSRQEDGIAEYVRPSRFLSADAGLRYGCCMPCIRVIVS